MAAVVYWTGGLGHDRYRARKFNQSASLFLRVQKGNFEKFNQMLNLRSKFNQTVLLGLLMLVTPIVMTAGCLSATPTTPPTPAPSATIAHTPTQTPTTQLNGTYTQAVINGHTLHLEVADDPAERTKGLMGRPSLPEDDAMLFVYPQEGIHGFWMKNTLIPLDILFIDKELKIANIQTMQPQPGVPDGQLRIYEPPVPVIYAIEMNGGLSQKHGFALGMRVELR